MAFKLLGIVLFLIEIVYFILRPIAQEVVRWRKDGATILTSRRTRTTVAIAGAGLLLAVVPWSTRISVPAVVEAAHIARVYPQRGGIVESVLFKPGDAVQAGDVLVQLVSIENEHQIALTKGKIALVRMRLARRASDSEDRAHSLVMEQELKAHISTLNGLMKERADLAIVAPHAGTDSRIQSRCSSRPCYWAG